MHLLLRHSIGGHSECAAGRGMNRSMGRRIAWGIGKGIWHCIVPGSGAHLWGKQYPCHECGFMGMIFHCKNSKRSVRGSAAV